MSFPIQSVVSPRSSTARGLSLSLEFVVTPLVSRVGTCVIERLHGEWLVLICCYCDAADEFLQWECVCVYIYMYVCGEPARKVHTHMCSCRFATASQKNLRLRFLGLGLFG